MEKEFHVQRLNFVNAASNLGDPLWEFNAIFEVASELLMQGADRASLLLYIGPQDSRFDCFAAFIGMLPFRGISVALLTQRTTHGDLARVATPSGVFRVDADDAARMGMYPACAIFGGLEDM